MKTSHIFNNTRTMTNEEMGAWNSLLTLTAKKDEENVYVHPWVKRSESTLSQKSLQMCTETLGSETGSEPREELESFSKNSRNRDHGGGTGARKATRYSGGRGGSCFPPPLTSISGPSGGVHVKRHREDGRLVVRVVRVASAQACFKAERENGRLRLSFVYDDRCGFEGVDKEGNLEKVEGEIGLDIRRAVSKCKKDESIKGEVMNLEAFWVVPAS